MQRHSPTVRRRRLAAILRDLRKADGRSAEDIAHTLGWSATKITRWEKPEGLTLPKVAEISRLLDAYTVTSSQRTAILTLATESRQHGWWQPYTPVLTSGRAHYIGLETEAWTLRNFEPMLIPGLLQTEDYARLAIAGIAPNTPPDTITTLLAIRMERQKLLVAEHPPHLHALIDETALHRLPGDNAIRAGQLQQLLDAAQTPNVQLQVVPFSAGIHPGTSPFSVITFGGIGGGSVDPEIVYVETKAGELFVEDRGEVAEYTDAFEHLVRLALSVPQTNTMINRLIADLPR